MTNPIPGEKSAMVARFDQMYRDESCVWGAEPSEGMLAVVPFLVPGRILDLGAGDGRNALYLATQGFEVTAVDIAPTAIANLLRYAEERGLAGKVQGVVADVETYEIPGQFENIISAMTLHFVRQDLFHPIMERIIAATAPGGVNVIEDFTRDGPLFSEASKGYWLKKDELAEIYSAKGWQVLHYAERTGTTKAVDNTGTPYQQTFAIVAARRPVL